MHSTRPFAAIPAVLFIASLATLVYAFVAVKLFFVLLFLGASGLDALYGRRIHFFPRIAKFYLSVGVVAIVWSFVGLLHVANYSGGAVDALRLYVGWSAAFCVLYCLLRSRPSLAWFHSALQLAAFAIVAINFAGLLSFFTGWTIIPDAAMQAMFLAIGVHDGYIQLTTNNIESLFLIVPYLIVLQLSTKTTRSTKVALALSLILAIVSGRRALWLVVAMTPLMVLALSYLTRVPVRARRILMLCAGSAVIGGVLLMAVPTVGAGNDTIAHLRDAFSSEDERTRQAPFLIRGFEESPVLGAGFGAYAGYPRNDVRPWTYELTYHQLLFNIGLIGVVCLGGIIALSFGRVVLLLRRFPSPQAFALLAAVCALFLGAYSNPYLGSFDSLFFVGLLPYLSTFERGFDERVPIAQGGEPI